MPARELAPRRLAHQMWRRSVCVLEALWRLLGDLLSSDVSLSPSRTSRLMTSSLSLRGRTRPSHPTTVATLYACLQNRVREK